MTAMLASVRSLAEAAIVADCGVDWIDLKDPGQGALGAVHPSIIAGVAAVHGQSHRISATIGDCWDTPEVIPARVGVAANAGAHYVKIGAFARAPQPRLLAALRTACAMPVRVILVCFAETAPTPDDVQRLAASGIVGIMLDTAEKHGAGLRGLVAPEDLQCFVDAARRLGLVTGLAGRLRADDVAPLLRHAPDYLGFRGALCGAGERTGDIDSQRVIALKQRIAYAFRAGTMKEGSHGLA